MDEPTTPEATSGPRIEITYCTQCRWLLRATWLASELLTSFGTAIGEVALRPGTGGVFRVRVGEAVVWDRKVDGGFPDLGPLKRLVRDRVAPGKSLGHTDRVSDAGNATAAADPGS
jgi:selenoprotein W-related protein